MALPESDGTPAATVSLTLAEVHALWGAVYENTDSMGKKVGGSIRLKLARALIALTDQPVNLAQLQALHKRDQDEAARSLDSQGGD